MAESFNLDESTRPPTFVQIREPAGPAIGRRMLFIGGVAIALAAAFGWAAWHPTADQVAPVAMQAAPAVTGPLSPQPDPAKLEIRTGQAHDRRCRIRAALDAGIADGRHIAVRCLSSRSPGAWRCAAAGARPATQAGSYEVSVRLGKGDTIASALQGLGVEAEAIADAVSALAPHVRLKRLPIGLGMTLQILPPDKEGARPILQALTLQPEGRREITVERDDGGQYVVELPNRK